MARKPVVVVLHADVLPSGMDAVAAAAEVRYATADTLAENLSGADVLLVWDFFSTALRRAWTEADSLRWIHVAAAGVDSLLFDELVDSDVLVTNSRGVFDRPIAEFVLATILGFAKDLPTSVRLQDSKLWRHRETESIAGTSVLVVGTGAIGRETARLLRAVGMRVAGSGRVGSDNDPDFGVVHASQELKTVVGEFDYVVLLAPLTDATRGMVDAGVLAAMKPTARLVNVGRGELVVTDDLVAALQARELAGAALDVFDTEPLPADHPLWQLDSVLITPHMSGDAVGWRDRLAELFVSNFERYAADHTLVNVVDKSRGY
ncbi:D-2-hydroxyacid dehydrogenase [Antrihabitans sp. NCIMB 15449]|uniref:D-2-hydroxyacid dehydrogenase n=1 Tax=Antrihabitans spumae TaxID=3373370 RepID=A0ABW7JWJ9_9NOCA